MKTLLWLDDYRCPFVDNWVVDAIPGFYGHIEWVASFEQFEKWINQRGLPDVISFDHDLADEHYTPQQYWDDYKASKEYQDSQDYVEKTGYDCAKWLVDYCLDNKKLELPEWHVHSANPVGADNIRGILTNYTKHIRNESN
jgi:hypothetical protein